MVILQSLAALFSPLTLITMTFGVVWGIFLGALPGFGGTVGVALLLPLTYSLDATQALPMLGGVFCGAMYGGSISAILIGVPGTSAAAATVFDGYELAKKGRGNLALTTALTASAFGGMFSAVVLLLVAPALAKVSLMFGPAEYFWLAIFGITIIATLSAGNLFRGLLSGVFGLLMSTIGIDPISGVTRFTFDSMYLFDGLPLIPTLLGIFAIPRCLMVVRDYYLVKDKEGLSAASQTNVDDPPITVKEFLAIWKTLLRSSIIGTVIGMIPAAGANIACFLGYSAAKNASETPEEFGTGIYEGVAAAEGANNAVCGGALVPLLTLGIPGNSVAAVIFAGLMIHGLIPGLELFEKHALPTYTFILSMFFANIIMVAIGWHGSRFIARLADIPTRLLAPIIVITSLAGSFTARQYTFDLWLTILFGFLCYMLTRAKFSMPAVLLGFILGPIAERGFRRQMIIGGGDIMTLFNRPVSLVIIGCTLLSLYLSARLIKREKSMASKDVAG